jgi:hypothetical protein
MKRMIRMFLVLLIIVLLYMLFLSIQRGIRAKDADDLTVTEQTDGDRNS